MAGNHGTQPSIGSFHPVYGFVALDELELIELTEMIHGVVETPHEELAFGGGHAPWSGDFGCEVIFGSCFDDSFEIAATLGEKLSALLFGLDVVQNAVSRFHVNFDIGI